MLVVFQLVIHNRLKTHIQVWLYSETATFHDPNNSQWIKKKLVFVLNILFHSEITSRYKSQIDCECGFLMISHEMHA